MQQQQRRQKQIVRQQLQVLHAVSLAYFLNATLNGIFFHCLLLSTGNIFVPMVAHAVHNAFALVLCHIKVCFRHQVQTVLPANHKIHSRLFDRQGWQNAVG